MEEQLPDYFDKRLGKDIIAFVARADGRLVASAYLLLIEKPANPSMPNGLVGEVLSVFTDNDKRTWNSALWAGIVYHRESIMGYYDDFDDLEELISFISTGKR